MRVHLYQNHAVEDSTLVQRERSLSNGTKRFQNRCKLELCNVLKQYSFQYLTVLARQAKLESALLQWDEYAQLFV